MNKTISTCIAVLVVAASTTELCAAEAAKTTPAVGPTAVQGTTVKTDGALDAAKDIQKNKTSKAKKKTSGVERKSGTSNAPASPEAPTPPPPPKGNLNLNAK